MNDCLSKKFKSKSIFLLELKTDKNLCMNRVIKRDIKERGKEKQQAENDFLKSWDIYYEKLKNKSINRNTNKFIITKNTKIDPILKKIFNLKH